MRWSFLDFHDKLFLFSTSISQESTWHVKYGCAKMKQDEAMGSPEETGMKPC